MHIINHIFYLCLAKGVLMHLQPLASSASLHSLFRLVHTLLLLGLSLCVTGPVEPYLTHFHTILHFDTLKIYSCGRHCEKRRNCNKQFLLFSQCFLPYIVLIFHFKCTLKCLQFISIWTSLKFCHLAMS